MAQNEPTTEKSSHIQDKLINALYFILFYFIGYIVWLLTVAISIFQFFYDLILKGPNQHLLKFGNSLNRYLYDIVRFISFGTETKPFPFSPWPN
jgi:Domain of unknown function (DUF4389)